MRGSVIEFRPPEPKDDSAKAMRQRYRNVFGTAEGRAVLGDILVLCHFGIPLNSEEERIEYNVGITIARMAGRLSEVDAMLGIVE
jgi:hypothetical protein